MRGRRIELPAWWGREGWGLDAILLVTLYLLLFLRCRPCWWISVFHSTYNAYKLYVCTMYVVILQQFATVCIIMWGDFFVTTVSLPVGSGCLTRSGKSVVLVFCSLLSSLWLMMTPPGRGTDFRKLRTYSKLGALGNASKNLSPTSEAVFVVLYFYEYIFYK